MVLCVRRSGYSGKTQGKYGFLVEERDGAMELWDREWRGWSSKLDNSGVNGCLGTDPAREAVAGVGSGGEEKIRL